MSSEKSAALVTKDQIDLVKRTVAHGATDEELRLYLHDCQRQGVHPLDKLLHFTKRAGKYTPVTSIDLMRTRAADTGEYAGSDDTVFSDDGRSATVTVWRMVQLQRCAFTATARWDEYYPGEGQGGTMWRKMPRTMLGKCAEALALRKGFPRQLAGLYASEELDQAPVDREMSRTPDPPETLINTVTGEVVPVTDRPAPPEGFRYIDQYEVSGAWHELVFNDWFGPEQPLQLSTKRPDRGALAAQAYQQGMPVAPIFTLRKDQKGRGYLDDLKVWTKPAEPLVPIVAADIPF